MSEKRGNKMSGAGSDDCQEENDELEQFKSEITKERKRGRVSDRK